MDIISLQELSLCAVRKLVNKPDHEVEMLDYKSFLERLANSPAGVDL